jgi:Tol biopolymer transport system component
MVFVALLALAMFAWPGIAQGGVIEQVKGGGWAGANGDHPSISQDGRWVAGQSPTPDAPQVWVCDRLTGTSTLVANMANDSTVSADGTFVAYHSVTNMLIRPYGPGSVWVQGTTGGPRERVSVASDGSFPTWTNEAPCPPDSSWGPSISADGRYVAFSSSWAGLVPGDANSADDVFVRDRLGGTTERVSVRSDGSEANGNSGCTSISADGRYVAFESDATNLVDGDANGMTDVFVHDRLTGTTERVSVNTDGAEGNGPSVGIDTSHESFATIAISADGRYVVFPSDADNFVPGDTNGQTDIFVRDRQTGATSRVSVAADGTQAAGASGSPSISGDGRYVVFHSKADNLVAGDTNGFQDVFLRDRQMDTTLRVSVTADGEEGDNRSGDPSISADGRCVAFDSLASNFVDRKPWSSFVFVVTDLTSIAYSSLRGTDRYDTAIQISQAMGVRQGLPDGHLAADSGLVLAPGETFQEALCGGPLASAYGGPVLLTPRSELDARVMSEISRLGPKYVFCIGLSSKVVNAVKAALPQAIVTAINGSSVYNMSYRVAKALAERVGDMSGATAIITRGDKFPDAVGVSSLACAQKWPILLTSGSNALSMSAAQAMGELGITKALKVGTYAKLPAWVTGLANLSGANRYRTNCNVAEWGENHAGLTFTHVGIATGDKFPDALAAGPYLAMDKGILLLSPLNGPVPACIAAEITAHAADICHVSLIAMIEPVIGQVKALLP